MTKSKGFALAMWLLVAILMVSTAFAQETTAGLQGTVKDPSGAVVSGATVEVTGPALIGTKKVVTDASGYYRFAQLPPGEYTLTVTAKGFKALKQAGLRLNTGALPTVDPKMEVGGTEQTVEVSSLAPIVDVTQSKVETNVEQQVITNIPKGRSFQSVIPFAPGARQEPLQSGRDDAGRKNGFQVDGASDSENVYMVEGMDTTDIQSGGIGRNVPFEFVQEVQVKSSSFEAEFGGALGGVVNVIQKRGGPQWHGSGFTYYTSDALNANDQCITRGVRNTTCGLRYIPGTKTNGRFDQPTEYYLQKKDHYKTIEPGFEIGGPMLKDRIWLFTSYVPSFDRTRRVVNYTNSKNPGPYGFTRTQDTHNAMSRIDGRIINSVRAFASWQYAYARTSGINVPATPDSIAGQVNRAASTDPTTIRTDSGRVYPSSVYNFGGDWTVTPKLVVTGRYGYFYTNTQDRLFPTGLRYVYNSDLTAGQTGIDGTDITAGNAFAINPSGFSNIQANLQGQKDALKRKSLSTDGSYFVGNFLGTHNFKFGYQQNRNSNDVQQGIFNSRVDIYWNDSYTPGTPTGRANCALIVAANGAAGATEGCRGNAGYFQVTDGAYTQGKAEGTNHALYLQDAWTVKGLTINAGVRFDKEYLPPYTPGSGSVDFGFGDKIAPRIGLAYDVLHDGKLKVYGSYGKFYDIIKFSLPRGSFGGDYWHDCVYALDTANYTLIKPTSPIVAAGSGSAIPHGCPSGDSTVTAPGVGGDVAGQWRFIENHNWRNNPINAQYPGVDPNLKPMSQHETVVGTDWAINSTLGLEIRYSRKRLDNTIEDIGVTDDYGFVIANPGSAFGDVLHRSTFDASSNTVLAAQCPTCQRQPKAVRNYDGLEFRLTKRASDKWFGSLSYTYSKLRGNYAGLTDSDITDGNGGRHDPNNNRAFDVPTMLFDANGRAINGPLATDRPHSFKAFGYYRVKWFNQETTFGLTQQAFSGTPLSTCVGSLATASSCMYVEGRGKWVDISQDATGKWVSNGVRERRSPVFSQMDLNFMHEMKVSKTNEGMRIGFEGNVNNLFNQRSVVSVVLQPLVPGTNDAIVIPSATNASGVDFLAMTSGFTYMNLINAQSKRFNSQYGKPNMFQGGRTIRLKVKFTF